MQSVVIQLGVNVYLPLIPNMSLYWVGSNDWTTASFIGNQFPITIQLAAATTSFTLVILQYSDRMTVPIFPQTVAIASASPTYTLNWRTSQPMTSAVTNVVTLYADSFQPIAPQPRLASPSYFSYECALKRLPLPVQTVVLNEAIPNNTGTSIAVCFDGTCVWTCSYPNVGAPTLSRVDANTGELLNTLPCGEHPYGLTFDGTRMWTTGADVTTIQPVDVTSAPQLNPNITNAVYANKPGAFDSFSNCFDGTFVWFSQSLWNTIIALQFDPVLGATVQVCASLGATVSNPTGMCSDQKGSIYVACTGNGTGSGIARVTYAKGDTSAVVTTQPMVTKQGQLATNAVSLLCIGSSVWTLDKRQNDNEVGSLIQIDTTTLTTLDSITIPANCIDICSDGVNIWAMYPTGLLRISTTTYITTPFSFPSTLRVLPAGIAFAGNYLWAATATLTPALLRISVN